MGFNSGFKGLNVVCNSLFATNSLDVSNCDLLTTLWVNSVYNFLAYVQRRAIYRFKMCFLALIQNIRRYKLAAVAICFGESKWLAGRNKSCDIRTGVRRVEISFQLATAARQPRCKKMIRLRIVTCFLSTYLFKYSNTLTKLREMRVGVNYCRWTLKDEITREIYLHIGQNYWNWFEYIYIYIYIYGLYKRPCTSCLTL